MPSNLAAPEMLPSVWATALRMTWRSALSRAALRLTGRLSPAGAARSRSSAVISLPSAMITARFSLFSSSRTLPGQAQFSIAASAPAAAARGATPRDLGFPLAGEGGKKMLGEQGGAAGALGEAGEANDDLGEPVIEV